MLWEGSVVPIDGMSLAAWMISAEIDGNVSVVSVMVGS